MDIDISVVLNLPHLRILDFSFSDKEAHIHCESTEGSAVCLVCLQSCTEVQMYQSLTIRDMALMGRKVFQHLKTRQFHCKDCNGYSNEQFSFVEKSSIMTIRYEKYLYFMLEDICINNLCMKEDICWSSMQRVYQKYAGKQIASRDVWNNVCYYSSHRDKNRV